MLLTDNYAKNRTVFYRLTYGVCLVYIDENKPVCIVN